MADDLWADSNGDLLADSNGDLFGCSECPCDPPAGCGCDSVPATVSLTLFAADNVGHSNSDCSSSPTANSEGYDQAATCTLTFDSDAFGTCKWTGTMSVDRDTASTYTADVDMLCTEGEDVWKIVIDSGSLLPDLVMTSPTWDGVYTEEDGACKPWIVQWQQQTATVTVS